MTRHPGRGGPHPALLVEWRQRDSQWWARVVYLDTEQGRLVEQWLPGDAVRPVGS